MNAQAVKNFLAPCKDYAGEDKTFKTLFNYITTTYHKEKAALYFDEDNKKVTYDYDEYASRAKDLAKRLSNCLKDIEDGATVALKIKNCHYWPLLFWAILMNGHPVLLIDARLASDNTENLISQSGAKAIVVNEPDPYSVKTLRLNEITGQRKNDSFSPKWADKAIFCSSGTTGDIKMMVMDGENMTNQIAESYLMGEEALYVMCPGKLNNLAMIPFHHIFGFVAVFLWYTFYGKTLVYPTSTATKDLLFAIQNAPCTNVYSVPMLWDGVATQVKRSMELRGEKWVKLFEKMVAYNCGEISRGAAGIAANGIFQSLVRKKVLGNHVRFCISGGGYLSKETSRIINGLGYPLYNGYGMTEIGVSSVELSSDVKDRLKGSIGHALYGVDYKIVRREGCAENEGELYVSSGVVHKEEIIGGVRKNTELIEGYFPTGDIAIKENDGRVYIKGRLKDTIISSNGENVYPDEIEGYFRPLPHLANKTIIGASDGHKEKIVLILEVDNGATEDDLKEIEKVFKEINDTLPSEKKVNEVAIYGKSLPIANNMKVRRATLKKEYEASSPLFRPLGGKPVNNISFEGFDEKEVKEVSEKVRKIFADTLLLSPLKISDDAIWTTDLGGDSMSYVSMIDDLNEAFGITFPIELYGKIGSVKDFTYHVLVLLKERK